MNEYIYAAIIVLCFALLNFYFIRARILKAENSLLKQSLKESQELLLKSKEDFKNEQIALIKAMKKEEEELKKEYEEQNSKLLNKNYNLLNEGSKKILNDLFKPLNEKIKQYNERLLINENKLENSIKYMFEYSQKIGEEANNLAKILKGDKKIRGNFAELQLKSVLNSSGLKEGEQYKTQVNLKEGGNNYFLDAVVFLDREKNIVIDAKFSLPSDFALDDNNDELCMNLAKNLKDRIDELSKKPYYKYNAYTYDFILLFIPYQNILDLALEAMPNIYQYAYSKKIYLTSPNTLFMALNTINISWRHIQSNENILKAFDELGSFYDKFVSFTEDFKKLKAGINALENNIEKMENKLINGKGNLSSKFDKLKELGAKTNKNIQLEYER